MTRQEILNNIKAEFKKIMFGETINLTTGDGKNILVMGNDAKEGFEVFEVDENNIQTPLSNGDYILSDGRTITVAEGKISAIVEVAPEEAPIEEEMATQTVEPIVEDTKVDTEIVDRLTALEDLVKEIMNGTVAKTEQMMTAHTELVNKVQMLSEQPSASTVIIPKKLSTEKSITDKMKEVREILNKAK